MAIYAARFTRQNFNFDPPFEEWVVVVLETDIQFENETLEKFEEALWKALYKQYPLWRCPYHSGKHPPNLFERIRHSFSTPVQDGRIRKLTG